MYKRQVIIPLVFVHLLVDLALDVLFNVQYLRLPAQDLLLSYNDELLQMDILHRGKAGVSREDIT